MLCAQVGTDLSLGWRTDLGELSRGQWCVVGLGGHKLHQPTGSPLLPFPTARHFRSSPTEALISTSPARAPPSVWSEHVRRLAGVPRGLAPPCLVLLGCGDAQVPHNLTWCNSSPLDVLSCSGAEPMQGSKASITAGRGEG